MPVSPRLYLSSVAFLRCLHQNTNPTTFRVALFGNGGVGRTCLPLPFWEAFFDQEHDPTDARVRHKEVDFDGSPIVVEIVGDTRVPSRREENEENLAFDCFMLVYRYDSRASYEELAEISESILRYKEGATQTPIMMVLSAKTGAEHLRTVPEFHGRRLAKTFGCPFLEVEPTSTLNIEGAIYQLWLLANHFAEQDSQPQRNNKKKKKLPKCSIL